MHNTSYLGVIMIQIALGKYFNKKAIFIYISEKESLPKAQAVKVKINK